jgi:uncharacterized protein (DUF433 family)
VHRQGPRQILGLRPDRVRVATPADIAAAIGALIGHTVNVTSNELLGLISIDPEICHGQACVKGTRVLVTVVLDALAAGMAPEEIVRHYPTLTDEGVRAAVAYGAWLAKQEVHLLPAGS